MAYLIKQNISLREVSNYKIGGIADYFLDFKTADQLKSGLTEWRQIAKAKGLDQKHILVIGQATNILFDDAGFRGLIAKNSIDTINFHKETASIGAGLAIDKLNNYCIENSLSGLEWSGGLPGTLGGAIYGNAGAFGGEMKDSIISVKSYDFKTENMLLRRNKECLFGYRSSIFKSHKLPEIILSAELEFKMGNSDQIRLAIEQKIDYRQKRQPLDFPSAGSTFKNFPVDQAPGKLIQFGRKEIKNDPFPVIPAAFLIASAGLSEARIGRAMISKKHPNFIVNTGGASSEDVSKLISLVQERIQSEFGILLQPEIIKISAEY
ncbi:MAG: UDP-N-acetylmuramate dehydrogenase [Patescibacteria group bacterium]